MDTLKYLEQHLKQLLQEKQSVLGEADAATVARLEADVTECKAQLAILENQLADTRSAMERSIRLDWEVASMQHAIDVARAGIAAATSKAKPSKVDGYDVRYWDDAPFDDVVLHAVPHAAAARMMMIIVDLHLREDRATYGVEKSDFIRAGIDAEYAHRCYKALIDAKILVQRHNDPSTLILSPRVQSEQVSKAIARMKAHKNLMTSCKKYGVTLEMPKAATEKPTHVGS